MKSATRPTISIILVVVIVLIPMLLVLGLGTLALQSGDQYEIGRQRDLLGNAFRSAATQVGWQLTPQVYWQEGYDEVTAGNVDWISKNQNTYLYDLFGYSRIYSLDAKDRPVAAFEHGAEADPAAFDAVAPSIIGAVNDVRQLSDNSPEAVGRIVQDKVAQDGTNLRLVIVGRLESVAGEPSIVVAATMLPDIDAAGFDGRPPLLIAVKALDDAFITRMSREFGFAGLKWGAETSDGWTTYDLTAASGGLVGTLSWLPDRPGSSFVREVWPALIIALLVLLLAAATAIFGTRRFVAAETGSRAKSAFLATMSHEIRTPLNGIVGMVDLLDGPDMSADQRAKLSIVRECSDALLSLINDILDFSKLESGMVDLDLRDFDLANTVDAVVNIASTRARPKGLGLIATYPLRKIHSDENRIRQILLNLIGNAVKFTETGDVRLEVAELGRRNGEDWLRFAVSDSGIGIAADRRHRVFHEFSQVDATITRRFGGSGLGLAICARLTAAMGGQIGFDSAEGKGSTFWFTLPIGTLPVPAQAALPDGKRIGLASPSAAALAQLAASLTRAGHVTETNPAEFRSDDFILVDVRSLATGAVALSDTDLKRALVFGFGASAYTIDAARVFDGPLTSRLIVQALAGSAFERRRRARQVGPREGRVLLVEDNRVNQQVATGLLERMGLSVEIAGDGQQAVTRVAEGGLDLVLMDMQMPIMDGIEATRRIRVSGGSYANVPIVGLTANAFVADKQACLDAGMNGFVAKPVNRQRLEGLVDQWLPRATGKETFGRPAGSGDLRGDGTASSAPAETRHDGLVDQAQQAALRTELGQDVLDSLIASFWDDAALLVSEINTPGREPDAIRRALHTLKGTAQTIGLAEIARVAAAAEEQFASSGHFDVAAVEHSISRTRVILADAAMRLSGKPAPRQAA